MRGFMFNNKHSYKDFGLILKKRSIQPPSKKKIKADVPFMNGYYDFSTVATNGEQVYTNRTIEIELGIPSISKSQLHIWYSNILEWLMDTGQQKLIFDDISDIYFLAEIEQAPALDEIIHFGEMKINFVAEPFKYGVNLEGSDIWDTFNFETDYAQITEFEVEGTKTITLYNSGRPVIPIINASSNMTATLGGYTTNLIEGDNKDYQFKLQTGANTIIVNGIGQIKFIFRKEML